MPINPALVLGVQPAQITAPDPFERYAKVLGIQGAMGQQADAEQARQENATLKALFRDKPNATAEDVSRVNPQLGLKFRAEELKAQESQAKIAKEMSETRIKAMEQHRSKLDEVEGPEAAARWVVAAYSDPVLGRDAERYGGPLEDALKRIPTDPQKLQEWKVTRALGATEYIKQNKPHLTTQELGGTSEIVSTPGLGGTPTVLRSAQKTLTPGEVQSGEHQKMMAGIAGGHLALARQNAEREKLTQPFEVTGQDGRKILVQQDKSNGALVDVNTKQRVTGVTPKPDAAEEGKLRDARVTENTLDRLIATFNPEFVGARGSVGEWQDKYLSQIPGMEKLAANPDRVQFRQLSATVVNNYINQITGATVGQGGEQQRLMRAVPTPDDSPAQFKAKMIEMKRNIQALPSIISNNPNLNPGAATATPTPGAPPTQPPQPQLPTQADIDTELRRRGIIK